MATITPLQQTLDLKQLNRRLATIDAEGLSALQTRFSELLFEQIAQCEDNFRLLDIGCGTGTTIEEIVRLVKLHMPNLEIMGIGVDLKTLPNEILGEVLKLTSRDSYSVIHGVQKGPQVLENSQHYAHFLNANATNLPILDSSINIIYSANTFVYIPDTLRALEEIYRVLIPGGKAYIFTSTEEISLDPSFSCVLQASNIPHGVFTVYSSDIPIGLANVIKITKLENCPTIRFPFKIKEEVHFEASPERPFATYFRSAIYEPIT